MQSLARRRRAHVSGSTLASSDEYTNFRAPKYILLLGNLVFLQQISVPSFGSDLPVWTLSSKFWYYIIFPCMCRAVFASGWKLKLTYMIIVLGFLFFFPHFMVKYFAIRLMGAAVWLLPAFHLGAVFRRLVLVGSTLGLAFYCFPL